MDRHVAFIQLSSQQLRMTALPHIMWAAGMIGVVAKQTQGHISSRTTCLTGMHVALLAGVRHDTEILPMCLTWLHLLGGLQRGLKCVALHL